MAALGSPSEHPLFLVSLPGALDSLQLEIGGPCAHLVEIVVAVEMRNCLLSLNKLSKQLILGGK